MADIILLLSILSTVSFKGTSSSYFTTSISNYGHLWSDMWSDEGECVPATPNVDVASSYPPTVYNVTTEKEIPDNEEVWVGYYQVERAFEYIGCAQHRQLFDTDPAFVSIKGDPGHCFPACGESTRIGVTKTRCYCLGDTHKVTGYTESGCNETCTYPPVACGQDMVPVKESYLSIYKVNPNVDVTSISLTETPQLAAGKRCLLISTDTTFYWEDCLLKKAVMCFNDGRLEKNVSKYYSWIDAAKRCFQIGRFPTLYSNSKDVNRSDSVPLWTGLFKTKVIYKYNADIPVERRHDQKKFGYLTKESNTNLQLKFEEKDSKKRVLCAEGYVNAVNILVFILLLVASFGFLATLVLAVKLDEDCTIRNFRNLVRSRRSSIQVTCETEFIGDWASTTIQDDGTGGVSEEIGIQNSLGERNDEGDGYGTATTQRSAYESLSDKHDEEHDYGASANKPLEEDGVDTYN